MKRLVLLLAAALLAAPNLAAAAVVDDEVTSQKLKEADGTSAQNTNSGSGVKTNHIQNLAVTGAKIANGTITATQLASGAVGAAQLASGAVGNAQLAAGAVTDSKITGPISAAKLGAHSHSLADVTGLGSALANKADLATIYQRFATVVVVSPDGRGDFTNPVAAMAAIVDASATKPYLVKILPGIYTVSSPIVMQSYVDIEGSGRGVTTIIGSAMPLGANLIELAGGAELRSLSLSSDSAWWVLHGSGLVRDVTIQVTGSPDGASRAAAALTGPVSLQDVDVNLRSTPGTFNVNAVNLAAGEGSFKNVSVDAAGDGEVYALTLGSEARATLDHVTLLATGGVLGSALDGGGEARVRDSRMTGKSTTGTAYGVGLSAADIANSESTAIAPVAVAVWAGRSVNNLSARIANTQITGQLLKRGYPGTYFKCIGVYDANYAPIACPQ